jgi:hypothetical protein
MSHQQQSGDNHERISKQRQSQICDKLNTFDFPASIGRYQFQYEAALEKATQQRQQLLSVLGEAMIHSANNFEAAFSNHPNVKQDVNLLAESQKERGASTDAALARLKFKILLGAEEIFKQEVPRPEEQYQVREILEQREAEIRGFLKSTKGEEFKLLINEWYHLEGEQELPGESIYRDLVRDFAITPTIDGRDVNERLQNALTRE